MSCAAVWARSQIHDIIEKKAFEDVADERSGNTKDSFVEFFEQYFIRQCVRQQRLAHSRIVNRDSPRSVVVRNKRKK